MSNLFVQPRRMHPILWLLLLAAGFALGLGAVYLLLAPRIVAFSPASDQTPGQYASIEVQFSVPMDPACAEAHIAILPTLPGRMEWEGATLRFTPSQPWPAHQAVQVTVQPGACSARGLPLLMGASWSFQPVGARIVYITSNEGTYQLLSIPAEGGDPVELLQTQTPIQDYHISPRGDFLVYSTGPHDAPGNLWILPLDGRKPELLLDCAGDSCRNPAISPDGSLVAFERAAMESTKSGVKIPLTPSIAMISLREKEVTNVSSADHISINPLWSPVGWLSYYDATDHVIVVDDLAGGKTFVPNATGEIWSWFPDGKRVIFPEMDLKGTPDESGDQPLQFFFHLILVRLEGNEREDISDILQLEDASPAISPDGRWLAFARRYLDSRFTPGRQLWLMNLEDFSARPLTNAPDFSYSSIRWSPDGSALVFMRFHETAPDDPPEIWRIDADGKNPLRLVVGGYLPQWLP